MKNSRLITLSIAFAAVAACASMNDAMTPSLRVIRDDFDGATIIRQPQVNAATFGEAFHTLGFEWSQRTPDIVYVTAGTIGITSLQDLAFNADGRVIENLKLASNTTSFDGTGAMTTSLRRFAISWDDFRTIATARTVKMKLSKTNGYTVSSFGPDAGNGMAVVNAKLAPFIEAVEKLRAEKR